MIRAWPKPIAMAVATVALLTGCASQAHHDAEHELEFDYPSYVTVADAVAASDLVVVVAGSQVHNPVSSTGVDAGWWPSAPLVAFDVTGSTPHGAAVSITVYGLDSQRAKLAEADASTDLRRRRPYVLLLRRVAGVSATEDSTVERYAPTGGPAGVFFVTGTNVTTAADSYAGLDSAPPFVLAPDPATGRTVKTAPPAIHAFDRLQFDQVIGQR